MDTNLENVLKNLVRVGIVSDVDKGKMRVRATFPEKDDMVSGWLYVLQHEGASVKVAEDGRHSHTDSQGGSTSTAAAHKHDGSTLGAWLPKVNDKVLVLYIPVQNGDGFVLGGYK